MNELGVLLPYQQRWVLDESTVSVWDKSRRIGASYAEALKSARLAMRNRDAGGQSTYYLSYNKEMTQQFVKDSAYWAKTFNAAVSDTEEVVLRNPDGDITVYRIRFASGFDIWGLRAAFSAFEAGTGHHRRSRLRRRSRRADQGCDGAAHVGRFRIDSFHTQRRRQRL